MGVSASFAGFAPLRLKAFFYLENSQKILTAKDAENFREERKEKPHWLNPAKT